MCNFFSLALIARMLGSVVQGEWALYINAYTLGTLALGFGVAPAFNHFIAADKIDKHKILGQLYSFALLAGIIYVLGFWLLSTTKLSGIIIPESLPLKFILGGLGGHFMLLLLNQLLASVLLAEKKFQTSAFISGLGALGLLCCYFYYSLQDAEPIEYFQIFVIINIVVLLFQSLLNTVFILRNKGYKFVPSFFSKHLVILILTFAGWAYITNFLQFLNYRMDWWFIEAYVHEDSKLGIYSVAVSLSQLIWLVPNAFHTVLFTNISSGEHSSTRKIYRWSGYILLFALLLALIGYSLSEWLVPFFFTNEYKGVIGVFPYLLPGIVLFAPSILWSAFFAGINRVSINFKSTVLGFAACLVANYVLIPQYGIIGAAVASSISYIISALFLFVMFRRHLNN